MSLIIEIKVIPSSGEQKWLLDKNGMLKAYLKSPPEKGMANKELIKLLSKALKIPQDDIFLLSGDKSRIKRVKIGMTISYERLLEALAIEIPEKQAKLF